MPIFFMCLGYVFFNTGPSFKLKKYVERKMFDEMRDLIFTVQDCMRTRWRGAVYVRPLRHKTKLGNTYTETQIYRN